MDSLFSLMYSRWFRLALAVIESMIVAAAVVFILNVTMHIVVEVVLFACVAVVFFDAVLSLSAQVISADGFERLLDIMMRTTSRNSFRPYVYGMTLVTSFLATMYFVTFASGPAAFFAILPIVVFAADRTNSMYMMHVIALIAESDDDDEVDAQR